MLAKARRTKELEAEKSGTATDIGTKQHGTQSEIQALTDKPPAQGSTAKVPTPLPEGKRFFAFLSHKKVGPTMVSMLVSLCDRNVFSTNTDALH